MTNVIRALRFPFSVDTGLSEFASDLDHEAHVDQLIRQVLFTAPGERVNRPDFGCGIRRMVHAPLSEASAGLAQVTVMDALDKWLSTVIAVERVDVAFEDSRLDLTIVYRLKTTGELRYLNVDVQG